MLAFLVGLLMVVILIALAIAYPAVRWALGIIAVVVFIAIMALVSYLQDSERKYKQQQAQQERQEAAQQAAAAREREAALHRVTAQELQFEDMTLGPLTYTRQTLRGRAHNLATRYSVSGAMLEITLKDCMGEKCEVVGTDYASLDFWIPPGQVRGVDATLTFKDLPPVRGTRRFEYQVTSILAQ